jgi:hypothetical protein
MTFWKEDCSQLTVLVRCANRPEVSRSVYWRKQLALTVLNVGPYYPGTAALTHLRPRRSETVRVSLLIHEEVASNRLSYFVILDKGYDSAVISGGWGGAGQGQMAQKFKKWCFAPRQPPTKVERVEVTRNDLVSIISKRGSLFIQKYV